MNVMDIRGMAIPGLMRASWITQQMHMVAKAAIITGPGEDGWPQKAIRRKWIMQKERSTAPLS